MNGFRKHGQRIGTALVMGWLLSACGPGIGTHPSEAPDPDAARGWPAMPVSERHAAGLMNEAVHEDHYRTAYCDCRYTPADGGAGRDTIDDPSACGFEAAEQWPESAAWATRARVVADGRLPTGDYECWTRAGGGRGWCVRQDPEARAMLMDLHNRMPLIEQVARYRGDAPFGEIAGDEGRIFGKCAVQVTETAFEPPDCRKGDVARIVMYMADEYDAGLSDARYEMLERWSESDPVSPWEMERARRIERVTGRRNDYVQDVESVDPGGACSGASRQEEESGGQEGESGGEDAG